MNHGLKIVIAGGSGQVGAILARHFYRRGQDVVVLARASQPSLWPITVWDGARLGSWTAALEGADVLINLAGRSVNCRYTAANRRAIMDSRVETTKLLSQAVAQAKHPPQLWMNASTATLYRHSLDRDMDEDTGEFGGNEPDAPSTWRFSIDVATRWEDAFFSAKTARTRKIALRSALILSPDRGGIFAELRRLVRLGFGGKAGNGEQYVSWIHELDFVAAVEYLINHQEIRGPVNLASPHPLPNAEFMAILRQACGAPFGLPAAQWMLEVGAFVLRTETELILKSRRVVPDRLLQSGFQFRFPLWQEAAADLVRRYRPAETPVAAAPADISS